MNYEFITLEIEKNIALLTLNRPDKRNAINRQTVVDLMHVLHQLETNHEIRVLIIKANGDHFCAGADIHWMQQLAVAPHNENYEDAILLADLLRQLHCFNKPVIALAHGVTAGGGLGLLCASDIVIAAADATFSFSEVSIGITPSTISPYAIAAIGERMARYYFLTGKRFDSKEAMRINLAHQVVERNQLMNEGLATAKILLANGPHAVAEAKKLIYFVGYEKINKELSHKTAGHLAKIRSAPEALEGFKAFSEKRTPSWSIK